MCPKPAKREYVFSDLKKVETEEEVNNKMLFALLKINFSHFGGLNNTIKF